MERRLFTARIICLAASLVIGTAGSSRSIAQPAEPFGGAEDLALQTELLFWESMKDSRNPEELRAYIDTYPKGRFVPLAKARLKALAEAKSSGRDRATPDPTPQPPQDSASTQTHSQTAPGLKPGDLFQDCDSCPKMVVLPAGRFEMGSGGHGSEERPPHEVVIPEDLAIGIYEITVEEWDACSKEGACRHAPPRDEEGNVPIANISWDDAQRYVKWLSDKTGQKYRLPSEAEWEYAARAGTASSYWWGDEKGKQTANCSDCGTPWSGKEPAPVGSFAPNPFGLYDVHGNVWEWVQDCWNPTYQGAPADGAPWLNGNCLSRVLRGGTYALDHEYMRSARRMHYDRDVLYYLHGLRVVRELPDKSEADAPFETAVLDAANKVFSNVLKAASGSVRRPVVMDPVVDGLSGAQSVATRTMLSRIAELISTRSPLLELKDFTESTTAEARYLVIGTFTGVNKQRKTTGERAAFRICLALLDLESGKIVSKAKVYSQTGGVDITPTQFFQDSPVWTPDPSTQAYIKSCQATKPGDPVDPLYLERVRAAALIDEGIKAYERGQYEESRGLFKATAEMQGGDQLRTYNGLYLTSWGLGEPNQAADAFGMLVDYGLKNGRLSIKFPFRPGSTDFIFDPKGGGQQDLWLRQIAGKTAPRSDCILITGHTHRVGSEAAVQDLGLRRAQYVKRRLEAEAPELENRITAAGNDSDANLIGSATGYTKDALDRRIELEVMACPPSAASSR